MTTIDADQATELLKGIPDGLGEHIHLPQELELLEGFDGSELTITGPTLVSRGLKVQGVLRVEESGLLVVLGQVDARASIVCGQMVVSGSFNAQHIYANSSNNHSLVVGGDLTATSVMEKGQEVIVLGKIVADVVISLANDIVAYHGISARHDFTDGLPDHGAIFAPHVLDANGRFLEANYVSALREADETALKL